MQNMKLLDLQTGKYLELGKDWLCGGKCVHLFTEEIEGFKEQEPINDAIHNGFYADCMYLKACDQDQPQEPLKTLCEQTGAVVYGDRYVLILTINVNNKSFKIGDYVGHGIFGIYNNTFQEYEDCNDCSHGFMDVKTKFYGFAIRWIYRGKIVYTLEFEKFLPGVLNIFEEYSKSLRGEENELNKLMELIK